jgi:hypothetical protein
MNFKNVIHFIPLTYEIESKFQAYSSARPFLIDMDGMWYNFNEKEAIMNVRKIRTEIIDRKG